MAQNRFIGLIAAGLAALTIGGCEREYTPPHPLVQERIVTHEYAGGGITIYQFHTRRDPSIKGATFIKQLRDDSYGVRTIAGQYQDLNKNGKVDNGDFCFITQGEAPEVPLEDRFVCSTHVLKTIHTEHPEEYSFSDNPTSLTQDADTLKTYSKDGIWHLLHGEETPEQTPQQVRNCMKGCPPNLLE